VLLLVMFKAVRPPEEVERLRGRTSPTEVAK